MAILVTFCIFLLVFWFIRKQAGTAFLATIAGLTIYQAFGQDFASFLHKVFDQAPVDLLQKLVYLSLVVILPLVLYFRSHHGGLFGIFRIIEAVIFAALMTSLISGHLAQFFNFDQLSRDLSNLIHQLRGLIIMAGSLTAYFEILITKE